LLALHHGKSRCDVALIVYIHLFDCFCTLKGSTILSGSAVNEINCYCPGGYSGNIPYIFAYNGCHIVVYGRVGEVSLILPKIPEQNSFRLR
jgi:hypothetical protein